MDQNSKKDNATIQSGRRALIKGAAVALPAILTLQSGAALARSSNMISAAPAEAAKDGEGRTLCMDRSSVTPLQGEQGELYDVGQHARVQAIEERDYYWKPSNRGWAAIDESEMCERGGTYIYRSYGPKTVDVRKGMLVSATALSSFAGRIDIVDI